MDRPAETIDEILDVAKKRKAKSAALSEDDLALALAAKHCHELSHVSLWGKWFRWNAPGWEVEKTPAAYDLTRKICRDPPIKGKIQ
jgi:hypothetical protein